MVEHKPVLLQEVIKYLSPNENKNFVDCTLGLGGHAEAILEKTGPKGILIGIDQDAEALEIAKDKLKRFETRFQPFLDNFTNLTSIVSGVTVNGGILADLGVSSLQLDKPEKGFSFQQEGPLDMRMDQTGELTAYQIVNTYSQQELVEILRKFGDEKFAANIAKNIVAKRSSAPINKTTELAQIVSESIPRRFWPKRINPATRTFQALRIVVNDELGSLTRFLPQAVEVLSPGARIAVITFHSREDQIVKKFFKHEENPCQCPPSFPQCQCGAIPTLKIINRKAIMAGDEEIATNPRSRSARLRVAEKIK